jgi:hypothetical protein
VVPERLAVKLVRKLSRGCWGDHDVPRGFESDDEPPCVQPRLAT